VRLANGQRARTLSRGSPLASEAAEQEQDPERKRRLLSVARELGGAARARRGGVRLISDSCARGSE
jgi:hypothetical protein